MNDRYTEQKTKALEMYRRAGIVIREDEAAGMEVADFGLGMVDTIGLELVVYINTDRVCAKEMVLLPGQTCPEHKHIPTQGSDGKVMPGKEETFRCRYGEVYLYVEGDGRRETIQVTLPPTDVTVFHEIVLHPGEQYTIYPETLHWFRAGEDGAVISEFSTKSTDETDVFTDPRIIR